MSTSDQPRERRERRYSWRFVLGIKVKFRRLRDSFRSKKVYDLTSITSVIPWIICMSWVNIEVYFFYCKCVTWFTFSSFIHISTTCWTTLNCVNCSVCSKFYSKFCKHFAYRRNAWHSCRRITSFEFQFSESSVCHKRKGKEINNLQRHYIGTSIVCQKILYIFYNTHTIYTSLLVYFRDLQANK